MIRTSWKKFRSTGEQQPILPAAPTGTITAFAGPAERIPGGWLNLTGGPYFASEYEDLAELLGVEVVSGVQYLALPRAPGTVTSTTQLTGQILKTRAILGSNDQVEPGTYGGLSSVPALTAAQTGLRAHTDHTLGIDHFHSFPGVTAHRHSVYRTGITIQYLSDADGGDPVNTPVFSATAGAQSFLSQSSTYGLYLDEETTDATLNTFVGDAISGHENRQPTIEMLYIIKT